MNALRVLPVVLSLLVLGAHFLRSGNLVAVALCLALPILLLVRRPWVPRVFEVVLVLAAAEWVRTLWGLARVRQAHGEPWTRMAVILGAVAAATAASALVFQSRGLTARYRGQAARGARNSSIGVQE